MLSSLDLNATPPFDHAHDHFGYRDRLSQPAIEGSGDEPTPGSGAPLKPGEFILGYPDEDGPPPTCRSRRCFRAMAASWPIGGWKNMWLSFATSCARTATRLRSRNSSRRN